VSRNPLAREKTSYHIVVRPHKVFRRGEAGDAYDIPGREFDISRYSEVDAKRLGILWAQSDAGVPPWLPYRRQGWKHVTAIKRVVEVVG
jgi:hypothetical protein